MRSIRTFLIIGTLLMLVLSSAISSLWTSWHSSHEVEELFDASLVQSARFFHGLVVDHQERETIEELRESLQQLNSEAGHWDFPDAAQLNPGHPYESKIAFEAWLDNGTLLLNVPEQFKAHMPTQAGFDLLELEGRLWRVYTLYDPDHGVWIRTGQNNVVREELTGQITRKLILPLLLTLPVLVVLIALVIQWGLGPLRAITRQLDSRGSNDLEPLPDQNLPDELKRMVEAVNHLFVRLQAGLEREKRFTDDAAHELRTPLAALRVHLETGDLRPELSDALLQAVERMERLVTQLLALSRLEPKEYQLQRQPTDLHELCGEVMADLIPLADAAQVELALSEQSVPTVDIDPTLSAMLVRNLVDNAIRYSPAGTLVNVSLMTRHEAVQLQIVDHGPGIPASAREAVFERFYRLDKSDGKGAGLGLSIVSLVARLQGARLALSDTPGGGLTVTVDWPR